MTTQAVVAPDRLLDALSVSMDNRENVRASCRSALATNQLRLVTHWDLRTTVFDILQQRLGHGIPQAHSMGATPQHRPQSLMKTIPKRRTCAEVYTDSLSL